MEDYKNNLELEAQTRRRFSLKYLLIFLVAIIVLGGAGMFVFTSSVNNTEPKLVLDEVVESEVLSQAEETTQEPLIVEVEGGSFYFKPNVIKVKKGQPVKIVFKNVDGTHDFVIDEFAVDSEEIKASQTTEIEFTPSEVGEFNFYCSVGNHRAMGMEGQLIVE